LLHGPIREKFRCVLPLHPAYLAQALKIARATPLDAPAPHLLVCLSGRGDKDLDQVRMRLGGSFSSDSAVAQAASMVEQIGKRTEYLAMTKQEG